MITALKLLSCEYKRFSVVISLIALLSIAAGLLGSAILHTPATFEPVAVATVDNDNTMESFLAWSVLSSVSNEQTLKFYKTTLDRANTMLAAGELNAVFIFPEGFTQSVLNGQNMPVQALYNPATPLSTALITTVANNGLALLQAAQSGVYASLYYTSSFAPEKYNDVFSRINTRLIRTALASNSMFARREVSATGETGATAYYLIHMLIFLHVLSMPLLCYPMRRACRPAILQSLKQLGHCGTYTVMPWLAAYTLFMLPCLILIFAAWALVASPLSLPVNVAMLYCLPIIALLLGTFVCLFALLFKHEISAGVSSCGLAAVSLLLSGGIIPLSYLPDYAVPLAKLMPQWWVCRMLGHAANGIFDPLAFMVLLGFVLLLLLICILCANYKGKPVKI